MNIVYKQIPKKHNKLKLVCLKRVESFLQFYRLTLGPLNFFLFIPKKKKQTKQQNTF